MDRDYLQLQQYIEKHPFARVQKDITLKIAYVSLLKYISEQCDADSFGSECMIRLMKDSFIGGDESFIEIVESTNSIYFKTKTGKLFKYKFMKYRYNILTDCLFINAFSDKKAGKKILNAVINLFPYSKNKLSFLFENFYDVKPDDIRKYFKSMEPIFSIIERNRSFLNKNVKRILITANMSAGKSTLMNALVGKKVCKTQNDTCTSKIHYIYNKAGEDGFTSKFDYDLNLNASRKELLEDDARNSELEIIVGTKFRSINEINSRVCLVDTPGVNSSQNKNHRDMTDDVISEKNFDLLIFMFNGENIGTDDDIRHLQYVKDNFKGKILFLVNKLDKFKKDIDSVPETLKKVQKDLTKLGFENPKVYPISAYAAYLAKNLMFGEKLTEDENDDMNFRNRKLSREEFRYDKYFCVGTPKIDENNENEVLLRNSGILSLEQLIY